MFLFAKGFGEPSATMLLSRNVLKLERLVLDPLDNPLVPDVDATRASFVVRIHDVDPGIGAICV